jgi:copper homeostasis protein (lipoprotein)
MRAALRTGGVAILATAGLLAVACGGSGDGSQNAEATTLTGMYTYMADAGLFADCATGTRYPVATEGDNAALESAYLDARGEPGQSMLVVVEGTLDDREHPETGGADTYLVVERFREVKPGETCPGMEAAVGLADTRWRLVVLGEDTLDVAPENQPFVELSSAGETATGYGGCNRFAGRWALDGEMLSVGHIGATRMHCEAAAELEAGFFEALSFVESYRIAGDTLVVLGQDGVSLARLVRGSGRP